MRIVIVEPNAQGGLIHFAYQMADALAGGGAEVTLITGTGYELADLPHRFRVDPTLRLLPIFASTGPGSRPGSRLARFGQRARRAGWLVRAWTGLTLRLRREKPDLVIFGVMNFAFQTLCIRGVAARGIPLIQVCHEIEKRDSARSWWDRRVNAPLFRAGYRAFSAIVFLAQSTEREFVAAFGDISRRRVLPHGPQLLFPPAEGTRASLASRYGIGAAERMVLFFGLLRPSKGVSDLVEAFARLPDRGGLRLVIAGYPTKVFDSAGLVRQVESLGIAGQTSLMLRYLPNEDVAPLLGLAEVVVFPYLNATASGAVATAQSLGRPVIATRVGGLAEVVTDGVTGRLVPPADPDALARALQAVLSDPEESAAMARAAREDLTRHRSWAVFAAGVMGLAEEIGVGDADAWGNATARAKISQK